MAETILSNPLFVNTILPFILVFTVVFAVLEKSGILGKEKKQIDAIVALVIGLIVVSYAKATGIIVGLMPFLAVALVVILVFLILLGSLFKQGDFKVASGIQIAVGILAAIALVIAVLVITGVWGSLIALFTGGGGELASNVIFIVLILVAIGVVVGFSGAGKSDS